MGERGKEEGRQRTAQMKTGRRAILIRMKVADFTPEQFKALIREGVEEALEDLVGDPDEGLELREALKARLRVPEDDENVSAEDVAEQLGLSW